jgi:hypothetical protein
MVVAVLLLGAWMTLTCAGYAIVASALWPEQTFWLMIALAGVVATMMLVAGADRVGDTTSGIAERPVPALVAASVRAVEAVLVEVARDLALLRVRRAAAHVVEPVADLAERLQTAADRTVGSARDPAAQLGLLRVELALH